MIFAISSTQNTELKQIESTQTKQTSSALEPEIEPDIVMPTKVSRPGCEEIDHCYVPSNIVIKKGESVVWQNQDAAFHSVTSGFYDSPSGLFDSGYLDPYQLFTFNFQETGTYHYFCTLHPWMEGQVIVE